MGEHHPRAMHSRTPKILILTPSLASKLASVVVHAQELLGPGAHAFDREALGQAAGDPEVKAWIAALGPLAPLPR